WNAIETALWDIVGKESGKPLYKIWGGAFRKKIPYFGIIMRDPGLTTEKVAELSVELVSRGFKTLFMKVGFDEEEDVEFVKAMREGVGYKSNIKIRLDANQAWTPGQAINMINRLEKYDLEFIDQPVLMYNLEEMARVRSAVSVPILSHESAWTFLRSSLILIALLMNLAINCISPSSMPRPVGSTGPNRRPLVTLGRSGS
ncbi:unnamed protein product, partial [marine sediment metagenome]